MCENDVIYTDDIDTAAVFHEILSNANEQADKFSFARLPANTWKRRNTGRIGVGAFRTTLKIGSYTDNRDNQPDFLLNLPGKSPDESSHELAPHQTSPKIRQRPQQHEPRTRSRHTHVNRKRQRRMHHPSRRKRNSKVRGSTRRRTSALNAWPEPATARKTQSCGDTSKSSFRQSRILSTKRKSHSKLEGVSLKQVLRSLDLSKRTKTKAFKSREAKPAWLTGLQQQVGSTDNQVIPSVRRKAASGLLARLQRVLRGEDSDLARLKHQNLFSTGSEHGDIRRFRSQITLECLRSRTTQFHHHCAAIVKQIERGSKPCESKIPEEGTALIAIFRHASSSSTYCQGTLIRVYAPWHLIPAAIAGEPPTLICTMAEVIVTSSGT